jgi:pantothenate kinase
VQLTFPRRVIVTDHVIETSALAPETRQAFIGLFRHVIDLYEAAGLPRYVLGLAGPTGSGKSVTAALFEDFATQLTLPFRFVGVGIDAWHFTNAYLSAHTIEGAVMKSFKGRHDTYDVARLARGLRAFREGQEMKFPAYSRLLHDPVEDAVEVPEGNVLLLLEGLWLLHDSPQWSEVRSLLDHSIFIEARKDKVRPAVIKRHVEGGRTAEDASDYYDSVDASNFDLVMQTKKRADEVIPSYFWHAPTARSGDRSSHA